MHDYQLEKALRDFYTTQPSTHDGRPMNPRDLFNQQIHSLFNRPQPTNHNNRKK